MGPLGRERRGGLRPLREGLLIESQEFTESQLPDGRRLWLAVELAVGEEEHRQVRSRGTLQPTSLQKAEILLDADEASVGLVPVFRLECVLILPSSVTENQSVTAAAFFERCPDVSSLEKSDARSTQPQDCPQFVPNFQDIEGS